MKKFLGTLFILLVSGGAVAPYVSGYYTKKYYYHALEGISQSQNYKIEVASYDMGWLKANARLKLTFPQSMQSHLCPDSKEPMVLIFEENIQHGPLLFGQGESKMQFALAKVQGKFVGIDDHTLKTCANLVAFKWPISPAEIYSSDSIVSLHGNIQTKLKGKPFEYKQNNITIKWKGLTGEINLNSNMTLLNYKILFPSLEIGQKDQVIKAKEMVLSGDQQKTTDLSRWLGKFTLNTSSFTLQDGHMMIGLNGLTLGHVLNSTNNLLSVSANYIVDALDFDGMKLGPINMMFSIHHIEPNFFEMINSVEEKAKASPEGYLGELKSYLSQNKEDALMLINQQLKKTPEAKIDQIIIQSQKGQILMNAIASIGGPEAKLDKLENYLTLLNKIKASGELNLDMPVFDYMLEKQSQETASTLPKEFWAQQQTTQEKWVSDNVAKLKDEAIKTGVFVSESKKMISRFKYENNNFTLNGKSIADIMTAYAELNKPKPVEPAPAAPAAPAASILVPQAPQMIIPMANNPNDPAKPSEAIKVNK